MSKEFLKMQKLAGLITENEQAYGHADIKNLKPGPGEYVELDDSSGELSGKIVKNVEYVKNMLNKAIKDQDWNKVTDAIRFIETQMK